MKTTFNEKFIAYLALISGLSISAVAIYYSVSGLTAIFAAAVVPVVIMGVVLEIGKLVATAWLKQNWKVAPLSFKISLLVSITILMAITSMGIFGFLSKAHIDQGVPSSDVAAKISLFDEQIRVERDNIEAARATLKQYDLGVDQLMSRTSDAKGAERAVNLRRSQQKDRAKLLLDISESQKKISEINTERAPLATQLRQVEAEVGPIKYIAAFFYGSTNPEILEKAVTWVIITLIVVFDPLAVILLLAAQTSFQNFRTREDLLSLNPVIPINSQTNYQPVPVESINEFKEIFKDEHGLTKISQENNIENVTETMPVETDIEQTSSYVQNEEQADSSLWSTTTNAISQDEYAKVSEERRQDVEINRWVSLVKSGDIKMIDVPKNILLEVRARM
jgi:hypothetical protein